MATWAATSHVARFIGWSIEISWMKLMCEIDFVPPVQVPVQGWNWFWGGVSQGVALGGHVMAPSAQLEWTGYPLYSKPDVEPQVAFGARPSGRFNIRHGEDSRAPQTWRTLKRRKRRAPATLSARTPWFTSKSGFVSPRFTACLAWFCFLLFIAPVQAQPILRVNTAVGNTGSGASNSWSVMVPAPTAGNTLVAVIALHASSYTTGVTGITQNGATWMRAAAAPNAGGVDTEIWYAPNVAAGAGTNVTVNTTYSWNSSAVIAEYSGLSPVSLPDAAAVNSGNSTAADTGTTPPTTQANELWFGGIGLASTTGTLGAPRNAFNLVSNTTSVYALEKIVSATGTADTGGTVSSSGAWGGAMVAFKSTPVLSINQITNVLAPVAGVHPRLFLNAAGVSALQALTNAGKYNFYWTNICAYAVNLAGQNPPGYSTNLDQRSNGDNIADMAFAWLLTGNANILNGAVNWATNICNYPEWNSPGFDGLSYGLAYGHELLGLAMLYDYAYTNLDAATRQLIFNTLTNRAAQQYQAFAAGVIGPNYLSNQNWIQSAGVLAAGLATFDQPTSPAALDWISLMEENFANSAQMLSPDGVHIEGKQYAEYGDQFLLSAFELSNQLLKTNLFSTAQAWGANTGSYLDDFLIPRNSWAYYGYYDGAAMVPFEDCNPIFLSSGAVLRGLAHHYGDTHAQWFADQLDNIPAMTFMNNCPTWQFLYWHDGTVPSVSDTNLPMFQTFTNFEVVSSRSDWSGNESQLTFKCGGPAGAYVPAQYGDIFNASGTAPGFGHNHPDAGSFCLYGAGQWLISEPGYFTRSTFYENTLIVDSTNGQDGETLAQAFGSPITTNNPSLTYVNSTPTLDTIVADATAAYVSTLGLQSFQRHVLFVKPNILLVGDSIQMNSTNHTLDLYFHLFNTNSVTVLTNGSLLSTTPNATMRIDLLTPAVSTMTNAIQGILARDSTDIGELLTLVTIGTTGRTNWQNVMAFNFTTNGSTPAKPTLVVSNGVNWVYQIGTHIVNLNWQAVPSSAPVVLSAEDARVYGTASTITASVSGGTGTVQFYVDGTNYGGAVPLTGGSATIPSTASLGAGTHTVMGIYSGDATHPAGAAASESVLTITPLPVSLSGTRAYDTTSNAPAAMLVVVNSLDGSNLALTGSGLLASKNVGAEPVSAGAFPVLVDVGTASASGTNAYVVTLPTKPINGNTLIAASLYRTGGTHNPSVNSISQTGANWTQAIYTNGCSAYVTEIWYATNVLNAGTNVTLNLIGSNPAGAAVMEYGGLLAVKPLDGADGNGSATAGTTADSGTVTLTTQSNELWIAAVGLNNSGDTLSPITGGFTPVTNVLGQASDNTFNLAILQRNASNTGSANTGGTISTASVWNGVITAFKSVQPAPPLTLSGPAAPNYTLTGLTGFVTITNAWLTVSGITASNKVYDGTALARLNTNNAVFLGDLDGTNVLLNLASALGTFLPDGSVGTNKTVQISGLTVSGSATNNYLLIQPTTVASIAAFKVGLNFSGNPTTLSATGNPGSSYVTQRSTNLLNWVNLSTNIAPAPSGVITITDSFGDLGGHQPRCSFYRLEH